MANSRLKTRGVEGEEVPISFMLLGNKADDVTHRVVSSLNYSFLTNILFIFYIYTGTRTCSSRLG